MATRFRPLENPSSFRKIAAAMWRHPTDPTIYGSLDIDVSVALAYLQSYRARTGVKVTIGHLVALALARAIAEHPDLNAKVRFWGRLEQRDTVDITLQVAADEGRDLGAARIERADQKSLREMAEEVARQARTIRSGNDENYAATRDLFKKLPWWAVRPVLRAAEFLTNELHVDLPKQGLPRDPFGVAMVTNVGMFGIDTAFAPFTPIARCPILVLVPEVRERPWVVEGRVVPRPILRLCATFDHRVIDGFHAGTLSRTVRGYITDPLSLEPLPADAHATVS
jgi:pyruvate/2-oxoglutarate dehydrogenase complex dihydrolipoamide acyltransferase (E2) component